MQYATVEEVPNVHTYVGTYHLSIPKVIMTSID